MLIPVVALPVVVAVPLHVVPDEVTHVEVAVGVTEMYETPPVPLPPESSDGRKEFGIEMP